MNVGVKRIDSLLVGRICRAGQREQGLAAKACLEGEDVASGKLSNEGELEGVFDGCCAADRGQEVFEASQVRAAGGSARRDRRRERPPSARTACAGLPATTRTDVVSISSA